MQQLLLEEALLRADDRNWCILSECPAQATIVMGVAGKPAELLDVEAVRRDNVPTIRRFSGGGTVIVDRGTLFASFILRSDCVQVRLPDPGKNKENA